jgi:hypothetical protein
VAQLVEALRYRPGGRGFDLLRDSNIIRTRIYMYVYVCIMCYACLVGQSVV